MSLQSPLGRFLGLGSARSGTGHWWSQRLTAVALVPLSFWLVASLLALDSYQYERVVAWLSQPLTAIAMLALLCALLYHAMLGVQVVVEDYVHAGWAKIALLILIKLGYALLAIAGIFSVVIVASGSAA